MGELLSALKSTAVEIADSKKAIASLSSVVAAALVLLASKAKFEWLDPDTAKLIAALIVGKAAVYVAAQAHVDGKKEQAASGGSLVGSSAGAAPVVTLTTGTSASSAG